MCIASTKYDNEGNVYSFKDPKINKYKDLTDLDKLLDKAMESMTLLGSEEDKLKEIYKKLTKQELYPDPNGETGPLHWIGMTFDHAPQSLLSPLYPVFKVKFLLQEQMLWRI